MEEMTENYWIPPSDDREVDYNETEGEEETPWRDNFIGQYEQEQYGEDEEEAVDNEEWAQNQPDLTGCSCKKKKRSGKKALEPELQLSPSELNDETEENDEAEEDQEKKKSLPFNCGCKKPKKGEGYQPSTKTKIQHGFPPLLEEIIQAVLTYREDSWEENDIYQFLAIYMQAKINARIRLQEENDMLLRSRILDPDRSLLVDVQNPSRPSNFAGEEEITYDDFNSYQLGQYTKWDEQQQKQGMVLRNKRLTAETVEGVKSDNDFGLDPVKSLEMHQNQKTYSEEGNNEEDDDGDEELMEKVKSDPDFGIDSEKFLEDFQKNMKKFSGLVDKDEEDETEAEKVQKSEEQKSEGADPQIDPVKSLEDIQKRDSGDDDEGADNKLDPSADLQKSKKSPLANDTVEKANDVDIH